jgi:DNA (cytosine-5)-methyltransferase 1
MTRKKSYLTVTDQFSGCGGSSSGAQAAGVEIKLALNHWKLAVESHNTNFPNADHDCTDISACDPRRYPSTDILITSPECTNHSLAKGKEVVKKQLKMYESGELDAAAERSRATMWDVCRFAEYHQYNGIIVENVVDARKWVMFDAWLMAMYALGYQHKCVYLNSMHAHPTPQSRDRMYVVFWKKGNRTPDLEFMPDAHCPKCNRDVKSVQSWKKDQKTYKYKTGYVYCCPTCSTVVDPYYYAAFNCIDWTDPGTRIGDRAKELSPKTVARIQYGLDKYGDKPMMIHTAYSKEARGVARPLEQPIFTQTSVPSQAIVVNDQHTSGVACRVRSVGEKLDTVASSHSMKLVTPFIIKLEHNNKAQKVTEELATQTTRQSQMLVSPNFRPASEPLPTQTTTQGMGFVTVHHGTSKAKAATDPINAVTASGVHSGIVTDRAFNSFIAAYYGGSNCTKHITEEMGTVTTGDRMTLINYEKPEIDDCYYRMLKPGEIQSAMAFNPDYVVLGNSREKVKQLGNAVTPPAMKWLTGQLVKALS